MSNEIERIYTELASIKDLITKNNSPSDIVAFEAIAAKTLVLASASYFEKAICDVLLSHAKTLSNSTSIASFIEMQALNRKYHTLFDWERNNINKFVRLFGKEFVEFVGPRLAEDGTKAAIKEFILIGQTRNMLVHENFAEFALEVTTDDIKGRFDVALPIVDFISNSLKDFEAGTKGD